MGSSQDPALGLVVGLVGGIAALVSSIATLIPIIERRKQRLREAKLHYDRAMEITRKAKRIRTPLSLEDPQAIGLEEEAIDELLQCLSKGPHRRIKAKTCFQLGHMFHAQGRAREAEKHLLEALRFARRQDEVLVETLFDLSLLCKDRGEIQMAKEHLQRILKRKPAHEGARDWLRILQEMEEDR